MPNGDGGRTRAGRPRGFAYLLLIGALGVMSAGMAALGQQWATAAQREREAELIFRGREFSQALAAWRDATPAGQPDAPLRLQDLLVDERGEARRHHLRRLYVDPFTGRADWELERDAEGRITAVRSRSRQPAMRRIQDPLRPGANPARPAVGDWLFEAAAPLVKTDVAENTPP